MRCNLPLVFHTFRPESVKYNRNYTSAPLRGACVIQIYECTYYIALKNVLSGAIYVFLQLYTSCTYSVFSPNRALVVPSLREQENRNSI